MAGKKNSRTSKTDHVLSLLAGGGTDRETAAPVPAAQEKPEPREHTESIPAARPAAPEHHLSPPILEVARLHNEALSETIREALTESLEQELDQTGQEAASQPPALEEVPADAPAAPEAAPETEAAPIIEEAQAPEEAPSAEEAPTAPEEAPRKEEAPAAEMSPVPEADLAPVTGPGKVLPDGSVFLNVMELLVEEPLEKYVKLFGLCSCPRCLADVRALALSRLPAKYVVLPASTVTPMLSLYQAKFDSMVISQVIQACKTVMESPRHTL